MRKSAKGDAELVLLDHGLYQQVPEKNRIALSHLWKAIVFNDHVNMKRYSNDLGVESNDFFLIIDISMTIKFFILQTMSYLLKF